MSVQVEPLIRELELAPAPRLAVLGEPPSAGRVALLSGSFDPPTVGHVALASAARSRVDVVLLVWSVRTLPKEGPAPPALLGARERVDAMRLVCESRDGLFVALASHGLLLDQVVAAGERFPGAELSVVVGSDKALQLLDPRWYEDRDAAMDELVRRARVLYAERAGDEGAVERALALPENAWWAGSFERLDVDPEVAAVSSRLVRDRLARGEDVSALVPPEVLDLVAPR